MEGKQSGSKPGGIGVTARYERGLGGPGRSAKGVAAEHMSALWRRELNTHREFINILKFMKNSFRII